MNTNIASRKDLPAYINVIYGDLYKNPRKCSAMDSVISCGFRTFFQYKKLVDSLTKEIKMNQSVLQMGLTFGNQIDEVAMAIGSYGQYDIMDVNPYEIDRVNEKYWKVYNCMNIFKQDATKIKPAPKYDVVICFMLLSMVPSAAKTKIVNNALQMVKKGGKAIFIDWHNPLYCHPLRYVTRMYNRLYHPFVEKLWDRDISTYATPELRAKFAWHKSTYFGRMFQKMVVINKNNRQIIEKSKKITYNSNTVGLADF